MSDHPIHCVEYADNAPTLLLLHGVTRNGHDWNRLLPGLRKHWNLVVADHLGHGQSPRSDGRYRVIDYARAMSNFVRQRFDAPITIMGHSLGAMVALWIAAESPSSVSGIILEDPPFHTMGNRIADTPYRAIFTGMQAIAQRGGEIEQMTDALAQIRIPTDDGTATLGELRDRASLRFSAESLQLVDPEIFTPLTTSRWLDDFDHESLWPRVACPVLLLQGDPNAGGAFTDADVESACNQLKNVKLIRFEGVSHQIHATCPERVLEELKSFSEGVLPPLDIGRSVKSAAER
ncbi:MAG: alpha/beta hydrolase [Pirellulaceae bacterium]